MVGFAHETPALAGSLRHLCLEMPADIRVCRPVLDTGPSVVRGLSTTDAGGSPAATHFRGNAKESMQRKAAPLLRPFWAASSCDAIQTTAVILSEAEGSAFLSANHLN
jgi:hypothetical protein